MNKIQLLLKEKKQNLLSVYYTAGFPKLEDTAEICHALQVSGADLVEIGMPFSDPVADGETIQKSNQVALENGMSLNKLFSQLSNLREKTNIPVILMGYANPILQYGIDEFCIKCKELAIDGTIIPDLPPELYIEKYSKIFKDNNLSNIFLITPQTSEDRIRFIDSQSDAFIYAVSSSAVTGGKIQMEKRTEYLKKLKTMGLRCPILVGFGVSTRQDFKEICTYANGAIIGSAFIRKLSDCNSNTRLNSIKDFVHDIVKSL